MVSFADFIAQFPEFDGCTEAFVQRFLDDAETRINRAVWDASSTKPKGDIGQKYLAAHLIALSPFGQQARLASESGATTYQAHYAALKREVALGVCVI